MENKKEIKLSQLEFKVSPNKLLFNVNTTSTKPGSIKLDDKLIPEQLKKLFNKDKTVKDVKINNEPSLSDRIVALECAVADLALKDIKE